MNTLLVLVLVVVALVIGGLGGWLARTPRRTAHVSEPAASLRDTAPDRHLVNALIGVHDLGDDVSATDRITEELGRVGIVRLDAAPGSDFDSSRHKAVQSVAAERTDQVGTVAAEVRPGWAGPDGILRYTEVSVFVSSRPPAGR